MNREVDNTDKLTVDKLTAYRWLFNPPALGSIPAKVQPSIMVRLYPSSQSAVSHVVMVRANCYYAAGCPLDLCEYAAARDLWAAMHSL